MDYKRISVTDEYYDCPSQRIGSTIAVSIERELSPAEKSFIHAKNIEITNLLRRNSVLNSSEFKQECSKDRAMIKDCFECPIYIEEIPSEYSKDDMNPWYIVTTNKGRIKIGWRKRVLHLEWTDSKIAHQAVNLFHDENVTKYDKVVHAYGYEKAKEYIGRLFTNP